MNPDQNVSPESGNQTDLPEVYKQINEESNRLTGWALLVFAGSLLSVLSTDYVKLEGEYRKLYLLCIISWGFLTASISLGQLITRSYLAGLMTGHWKDIAGIINLRFARQIRFFIIALALLGLWLTAIVLIWIFLPTCS